jgi:hypothetical protein
MVPGVSYEEEIEAWRARRLASLRARDGWLALVGLFWLHEGQNSVGSDPGADVVPSTGSIPSRLGWIDVADGRATARFPPGSRVTHERAKVTTLVLRDDREGKPTKLALGTLRFHVIHRAGRLAVRVRDRASPAPRSVTHLPHYPVDPRWRLQATFHPHDPVPQLVLPSIVGPGQEYRVPGTVSFEVGGKALALEAYQELDERDLFIVFGDETNGTETYGGGRYLYASAPGSDGIVVLDFNRSYNPPCAFTLYATCVLAQPGNRLPIRIEAGEKRHEAETG